LEEQSNIDANSHRPDGVSKLKHSLTLFLTKFKIYN